MSHNNAEKYKKSVAFTFKATGKAKVCHSQQELLDLDTLFRRAGCRTEVQPIIYNKYHELDHYVVIIRKGLFKIMEEADFPLDDIYDFHDDKYHLCESYEEFLGAKTSPSLLEIAQNYISKFFKCIDKFDDFYIRTETHYEADNSRHTELFMKKQNECDDNLFGGIVGKSSSVLFGPDLELILDHGDIYVISYFDHTSEKNNDCPDLLNENESESNKSKFEQYDEYKYYESQYNKYNKYDRSDDSLIEGYFGC